MLAGAGIAGLAIAFAAQESIANVFGGISLFADKAYEIEYEYYMEPVDLENATDVATIPERFRHVIVDGIMYYAYMFRDNIEMASVSQRKFDEGIKQMRTVTVNENVYMRAS